jgi:hypothetical protein
MPQSKPLVLLVHDTITHTTRLYEYDQTTIDQIKSKQHVFWDDVPDTTGIAQLIENKRATA